MPGEQKDQLDRVELLSWLETLERNFDPLLLKGRNRFNEAEGWVGIWLFRSLIGTNYKKMPEDSVNKVIDIFSSRWQTWVTYAALAGIFGVPSVLNLQLTFWQSVLAYGVIVISLVMSLYANLNRMLSMGDPYFNSNAYKLFRRQEYYMFLAYFREHKYTFRTAHEWVKLLYKENGLDSVIAEHKEIQRQWREMVEDLKKSLDERDRSLKKTETMVRLLNRKIEQLQRLAKVNEDGFNSAISTIYRLRSSDPLFNTSDLRVVTDFSLFELVEPKLIRLCEQGTTETPKIIDINDPAYAHYSSVKLVHGENTIEYATSDREGRTVASYWIDLPSGRTLIYNFHYDSTIEDMDDIIEMKEMYRYIKGICMHLDERGLLTREAQRHVAK
ncbi:hypothetical protein Theco_3981 (plasmid) [Thermobacillus composti KWC4]|uniref:Uncharacterized protein n=1 Tax=Thermobacillus composti (strain DSM 18247 / JCM 13945 / KWC4) TaxID=717605 RepID=L0EL21_THECK|nr:hypothetical protein [Thermobacillus composti]AGA59985.1 hypothetical protein Theco_3981 [Thermobacillus composti KWC4]